MLCNNPMPTFQKTMIEKACCAWYCDLAAGMDSHFTFRTLKKQGSFHCHGNEKWECDLLRRWFKMWQER